MKPICVSLIALVVVVVAGIIVFRIADDGEPKPYQARSDAIEACRDGCLIGEIPDNQWFYIYPTFIYSFTDTHVLIDRQARVQIIYDYWYTSPTDALVYKDEMGQFYVEKPELWGGDWASYTADFRTMEFISARRIG